jgi:hypothetical protein
MTTSPPLLLATPAARQAMPDLPLQGIDRAAIRPNGAIPLNFFSPFAMLGRQLAYTQRA